MLYVRLLKNIAGSDGTLFLKGNHVWARVQDNRPTLRYKTTNGHFQLRLKPDHFEVVICDPAHEELYGVKFEGKNSGKGGE